MTIHEDPAATVPIGGKEVPVWLAALIAQEADRLGLLPSKVGDLVLPERVPTHVQIAGFTFTVEAAAQLAAEADAREMLLPEVMGALLDEHFARRKRRGKEGRGSTWRRVTSVASLRSTGPMPSRRSSAVRKRSGRWFRSQGSSLWPDWIQMRSRHLRP